MSNATRLQRYQCHKQVSAGKILFMAKDEQGGKLMLHIDNLANIVPVDLAYLEKHKPQIGGYYVVYEDGYESFSPAEAFEQGYSLIEAGPKDTGTRKAAKKLAAQLNGSQYPLRVSNELTEQAKAAGLVIVYGASDDLMEFQGAIGGELTAMGGRIVLVDADGLLPDNADDIEADEDRARYYYRKGKAKTIDALWCKEPDYSWTYHTAIPHETFEVVEDGQPYCRGIVFALADLGV